jgi:hypothetical protein
MIRLKGPSPDFLVLLFLTFLFYIVFYFLAGFASLAILGWMIPQPPITVLGLTLTRTTLDLIVVASSYPLAVLFFIGIVKLYKSSMPVKQIVLGFVIGTMIIALITSFIRIFSTF